MRSFLYTASAFLAAATAVLASPTPIGRYVGCDCGRVTLSPEILVDSSNASNALPPPPQGQLLKRVVVGYGTQNYSCSNGQVVPNGAKAVLYDVSCPVSSNSGIEKYLAPVALHTDPNFQSTFVKLCSSILQAQANVGVHDFQGDFATPVFHFSDKKSKFCGAVANKIPAPPGSDSGKKPDNHGAVPWLRLTSKPGMGSTYSTVYRLYTAGGQTPPGPCNGPQVIPYAAMYYFY
ncbi:hypothetical protein TWF696_001166 [Orbilia brochopaga]|uniref:Uncharacterized protein n=1 Tax=Orbilia brochopaga TaxID=3140254 RepID=A0AAV9VF67_9PEZI